MKAIIFLLLISISSFAQKSDTTTNILLNRDTLLTIKTTTNKTSSVSYTETSVIQIVKPFKVADTIVTPPPVVQPSKYEGFGSQAVGGSQSTVVKSVGSKAEFEAAIGSNRTIKFNQSVTFQGRYDLANISYLTIDGNGFDVTINNNNAGDGISFDGPNTHHCILTGIRVINAGNDGINVVDGAHDIMIDHCSSYGNRDGNIDIAGSSTGQTKNITIQYCFIGGIQPGGSGSTLVTAQNVSIHHNLYTPSSVDKANGMTLGNVQERCPYVHANYSPVGNPNCDFKNNLIYKWGRYASGIGYKATGNFVNNYYTPNQTGAFDPAADPSGNTASYYTSGNLLAGAIYNAASNHAEYTISSPYKITMTDAKTAANDVLKGVGTAVKNPFEQSVINSITIQ